MINIIILCLLTIAFILDIILLFKYRKELRLLDIKMQCLSGEINWLKHRADVVETNLRKEKHENRRAAQYE